MQVTPRIASSYGWEYVCLLYGGFIGVFSVLWQLIAANKPGPRPAAALKTASATDAPVEPTGKETELKGVDWRIFGTPAVLAVCFAQVATNK